MEINVEIKNLTKKDIIDILAVAFSGTLWANDEPIEDLARTLLKGNKIEIINFEDSEKYILSLNNLCKGIELFIKNGGSTNISNYDSSDGDKILQYALFGILMF